jgi:hypothetical protein
MLKQLMKRFEDEFVGQSRVWEPVSDSMYCGRISDAELESMRMRNETAIKECIKSMGDKWILHSSHKVCRLTESQYGI